MTVKFWMDDHDETKMKMDIREMVTFWDGIVHPAQMGH